MRAGEFYRHFKNKLYQIIAVAVHSETNEKMVVYQALYGNYGIYVRPYAMFVSEVDHEKYPDVKQRYRFERIEPEAMSVQKQEGCPDAAWEAEQTVNPHLLDFLDSNNFEEQMECLDCLAETASQSELDSIYLALDIKPTVGTVSEQIEHIKRCLSMQHHFDGRRLR